MGYIAHVREMRNPPRISVRKRGGKRPLLRPRYKWEDNVNHLYAVCHCLRMVDHATLTPKLLKPRIKAWPTTLSHGDLNPIFPYGKG